MFCRHVDGVVGPDTIEFQLHDRVLRTSISGRDRCLDPVSSWWFDARKDARCNFVRLDLCLQMESVVLILCAVTEITMARQSRV